MQLVRQDQIKGQKLEYLLNDVDYLYNDYGIVYLGTTKFYNKGFLDYSTKQNSDVWASIDFKPSIYEAYFGLYDAENDKVYRDLKFSTLQEVKDYITNLGLDNSRKSFLFHYYKKIKYLGALNVFGYNMFFSMIKDNAMTMKSGSINHLTWSVNRSGYSNFVETIVKNVIGYSGYTASNGDNGPKSLWIPKNKQKMYGGFVGINIGVDINTGRYMYDGSSLSQADGTWELDLSGGYIMGVDSSQNIGRMGLADMRLYFSNFWKNGNYQSFIRVYKIRQSSGGGYDYAAYIKPIGIDVLQIEGYDTNKYELLLVYKKKNKVIETKTLTPDEDYTGTKGRVRFFGNKRRNKKIGGPKDRNLERRIEIYLKEKGTGNIIAMSNKVLRPISFKYNPMGYVLEHI